MLSFKGKVVIITGASSGMGEVTAEHFARLGATLVLCGRNVQNLNKVVLKCASNNCPKPLAVIGDIKDEKTTRDIVDSAIKAFGRIDVLVNNAGAFKMGGMDSVLDQFDEMIGTNLRAVVRLTHAAVPHLIKTKGSIINISSVLGMRPSPSYIAYSMSKAALDHFTRCLSVELAPKGVRVNAVSPGIVATNLFTASGFSDEVAKQIAEHGAKTHPMGRIGQPEDIAKGIVFLASDLAGFVTGTILPIDGGLHNTSAE